MRSLFILLAVIYTGTAYTQTDSLSAKFPVNTGYLSSFDNTKIYYECRGNGKPVVLIHGFIVNSNSWKKTAMYTDLLNNGYRVILLDLRGNGKSDKPHDSTAYENDAEAKDVMLLMDKLKIKNYAVIGYSRGSIITAKLLALDKRIHAAVLGGMGTDFTNPDWPRRIMFYHALRGDSIPEMKAVIDNISRQNLDRTALMWMQRYQPSTSIQTLNKVKQPVLVICGDQDSDNGSAADLAKLFKRSSFATVPGNHGGAYHTPQFSTEIQKFLKENY
ncbi:alpha/beta hydrolase [Terrimonas sp.]|uniref:alpha/beta fold hydrolase n=1 Tax=Terrimonas sp. TaxID=1914338 RepID=UPI000D518935|nr:alpha/beta hydrolase [Terrimonas sp.]PVD50320.1 alpha/beta hydrolase [Terrimonas sp.]